MEPNRARPPLSLTPAENALFASLISDMPPGTEGVDELVVKSAVAVSTTPQGPTPTVAATALRVYARASAPPAPSYGQPFICPTPAQRREMAKNFFPDWDGVEQPGEYEEDLGFTQHNVEQQFQPAVFLGKPTQFGLTSPKPGECLFAAFAYWLTGDPLNHQHVRNRIAEYILTHPDSVPRAAMVDELTGANIPFLSDEPTETLAEQYAMLVAMPGRWGGDELLSVFAKMAKCNVWMHVSDQKGNSAFGTHVDSWQACGPLIPGAPSVYFNYQPARNHWRSVVAVRSY
ncbi:hypothetical protein NCLIV_039450 [Neospora caninum Liverpool]|uniref:OTU domain-containing protein n=1 Tax=Neospora caninum (strain Liverpool) TaxID=572307 RepID=F0VB48_NEOCL|nr:hypothetical protein NCLIV_039450 [Neospora caninum Liverpool]CBZ50870.1 hypothetical protein NCLIV_039450 [Neospora caninum Liverpool]CEL68172.1 TPA: hypothetical protein BN1204_039450 [Neospora caninum Liverpool]|eukprot:XP_003880903.1 hypothetical protein NCLIV_039450 [Neospora caninum Liverpool]